MRPYILPILTLRFIVMLLSCLFNFCCWLGYFRVAVAVFLVLSNQSPGRMVYLLF
ncbi:hypothetical protein DSUL_20270 [Desulfovibrionales bacterium]